MNLQKATKPSSHFTYNLHQRQSLVNQFPKPTLNASNNPMRSPHELSIWNSDNNFSVFPQKKSFTDFAIVHMGTMSSEQLNSPSRYEDSYEVFPDEEYIAQMSIFNDMNGSQKREVVYVHDESFDEGLMSQQDALMSTQQGILSEQVTQNNEIHPKALHFKPSTLFTITEKISKENINRGRRNSSNYTEKQKENLDVEPKKTTLNLMDLIKDYTNNPNLEKKIKMNKTSFLTNNHKSENKENQITGQNLETLNSTSGKKGQTKSIFKKDPIISKKERANEVIMQSKSASKSVKKSVFPVPKRSRSKSGEKLDVKMLDQSINESVINSSSHVRSLSSHNRRPTMSTLNNDCSFILGFDGLNNVSIIQKEQDQIITTLNATMQKLLKKTENNSRELEKLKELRTIETQKMKTNQTRLEKLRNQYINPLASVMPDKNEHIYNPDFLAKQSDELLLRGPFQQYNKAETQNYSSLFHNNTVQHPDKDKDLDEILKKKLEELNQIKSLINNLQQTEAQPKKEKAKNTSKKMMPVQPNHTNSGFTRISSRKMNETKNQSVSTEGLYSTMSS